MYITFFNLYKNIHGGYLYTHTHTYILPDDAGKLDTNLRQEMDPDDIT